MGGFHLALRRLGHKCVFACELDPLLRHLYHENFGLEPAGDIRKIDIGTIPSHDLLCAGFPCQPFSKAGDQGGFGCPRWGDLFDYVLRVIAHHRPPYFILENVPNIQRHDGGRTWRAIQSRLCREGYAVSASRLSPHHFGIPQIRDRLFVVGSLEGLAGFEWPQKLPSPTLSLRDQLDRNPPDARPISDQIARCLDTWQQFLEQFPADSDLPSFPIWSMEFGATYPFEDATPFSVGVEALAAYRGSHGIDLAGVSRHERMLALPSYARVSTIAFPKWKVDFIAHNRTLYAENKAWLDGWLPSIREFPPSLQKLEWNCKGEPRDIWQYVIQFRASGVRVKRPTTAPSLVAMTTTQVPIIAWERRYMTPRECSRLQSMQELQLPSSQSRAFKALGNAVNVDVVQRIAVCLLGTGVQPVAPSVPSVGTPDRHQSEAA